MNASFKLILLILFLVFFIFPIKADAVYDPLSVPNNKMGVHILYVSELEKAASLVNASGGDWGYVTIPIQSNDKDLDKWEEFMNNAKKLHIIPIVRIATTGDYFNTKVWSKPSFEEVIGFVNFLNSLDWPTKNRYVLIYNEPNRGDEWGGSPNPQEYAEVLSFAATTFKSRSSDFFIISAGMDNAAANIPGVSINEYDYFWQMNKAMPGIFEQMDGIGSHSYPNPGFSSSPFANSNESVASFSLEKNLIESLSSKKFPVFITETGWSEIALSDEQMSDYMDVALKGVWSDSNIAAITPFILEAGGPFEQFSLIKSGQKTKRYLAIEKFPKVQGKPEITESSRVLSGSSSGKLPVIKKKFKNESSPDLNATFKAFKTFAKWLLRF